MKDAAKMVAIVLALGVLLAQWVFSALGIYTYVQEGDCTASGAWLVYILAGTLFPPYAWVLYRVAKLNQ